MAKLARWSATSAFILTCFVLFDALSAARGDLEGLLWFAILTPSMAVEWVAFQGWRTGNLRAPFLSGVNQFWLGVLAGGHMAWEAYHPAILSEGHLPMAPGMVEMVKKLSLLLYLGGGALVFLTQWLIAYRFWVGGPRGYRVAAWRLRKDGPASD